MKESVTYTENALIIRIPTHSPALLHENLLRGIAAVLRKQILHKGSEAEDDAVICLVDLQEALIPPENQLVKAHSKSLII